MLKEMVINLYQINFNINTPTLSPEGFAMDIVKYDRLDWVSEFYHISIIVD